MPLFSETYCLKLCYWWLFPAPSRTDFLAPFRLENKKEAVVFAALTVLIITVANITVLEIVFRDIGLLLASSSFWGLASKK